MSRRENKMRKQKSRGVGIFSPNLVTDEAQSLLTVMTELPELMWSPMALSKLKWEIMKGGKKSQKEAIKEIYSLCVLHLLLLFFFFLVLSPCSPTCKPSKIPHTLRATCEKASHVPHVLKPLAFNLWDSLIWKGWARMLFKLRQSLIQTRPDSLLCSEQKVSAVKSH